MTKYVWWEGDWREIDTSAPRPKSIFPSIWRDIEYKSPLGTGMVTSRSQRREELKRHNCREVDPSEMRVEYHNERFAKKHGLKHTPVETAPQSYAPRDPVPNLDHLKR